MNDDKWNISWSFVTQTWLLNQWRSTILLIFSWRNNYLPPRATRFLVLYVVFCRSLFVLFLLAIVLSVLLRFRDSDYPFGICNLFFQHPIFHIHIVKLVLPMNRQSICMFCRSLFVLLYFFFWSLCCLFFNIRILNTTLVYSNSSLVSFSWKL
jgi:hypothetical protein